jgi:hypothetical protein
VADRNELPFRVSIVFKFGCQRRDSLPGFDFIIRKRDINGKQLELEGNTGAKV